MRITKIKDLHILPRLRDSLSYLYVEHAKIEQSNHAIDIYDQDGITHVPITALTALMLGPGTSITHAAIKTLADNGCLVNWTGEDGVRFYAHGTGETRKAYHLLRQAELSCDPHKRLDVVMKMYRYRFKEPLEPGMSLQVIRGMEGARVRKAYADASKYYGVRWVARNYDRSNWNNADPLNRALSSANACLNAVCHAAIVSGGYSTALGFIHTGKQLSFVYDIADLYKVDITVPVAFRTVAESTQKVEARVRQNCRQAFKEARLLERILPDIDQLLDIPAEAAEAREADADDDAKPEDWWGPSDAETGDDKHIEGAVPAPGTDGPQEASDDGDDS
jgi:CRISPR-associated protein Cas1